MSFRYGCNYENVKKFCDKYECELLENKINFTGENLPNIKVKLKCGCIQEPSYNKLVYKRQVYCKKCREIKKKEGVECCHCKKIFLPTNMSFLYCTKSCSSASNTHSEEMKLKMSILMKKRYIENNMMTITHRKIGLNIFKSLCENDFIIHFQNIQDISTVLIRPKETNKYYNNFMPLYIKTTKSALKGRADYSIIKKKGKDGEFETTKVLTNPNLNSYYFKLPKAYNDVLVMLICIDDNKFWIIDGSELLTDNISIGEKSSKYNKYLVDKSQIVTVLHNKFYTCDFLQTLESSLKKIKVFEE
jgi:hypothetical protein